MLENLNKTIKLVKDITQYKNVFFYVVFYSSISSELESSLLFPVSNFPFFLKSPISSKQFLTLF